MASARLARVDTGVQLLPSLDTATAGESVQDASDTSNTTDSTGRGAPRSATTKAVVHRVGTGRPGSGTAATAPAGTE